MHPRSQLSAASAVLQYWQLGTSNVARLKRAARQHARFLACRSLQAWQHALFIKFTKLCLLHQALSLYHDALCARAFQAWLVYFTQCMQQELAVQAAVEKLQTRMLSKVLWGWHVFTRNERAIQLQNMHAAVVFRSTYLQQAAFGSWLQWVWILLPLRGFNSCSGLECPLIPYEPA
jgi:hypothetical protein